MRKIKESHFWNLTYSSWSQKGPFITLILTCQLLSSEHFLASHRKNIGLSPRCGLDEYLKTTAVRWIIWQTPVHISHRLFWSPWQIHRTGAKVLLKVEFCPAHTTHEAKITTQSRWERFGFLPRQPSLKKWTQHLILPFGIINNRNPAG